ncbi:50S ribosomal protein L6 [Elstera cyanobacteriorum]|uniref:Large ribosomal subunit protein uL6 n=1 Tax=Elstera cyanobacteriorum TaxID=2022747 RepID=A0A255XTW6_9PROT|nr:50S ribosomal protein L6 [Elstera cyanobacteriorum]MCK6444468.1 50S ribosomal protein L6 [Elstera cyanobacteriorum]OYQ20363.1 50S ribosomal protein L6 [Elstera cyanobacteriorum]GFZ98606.1 50S ribosomal protein L6 [Elstera cyanobacteriorum]
MSRVGKYPVSVPAGVTVSVKDGVLEAQGKLGTLSLTLSSDVETTVDGNSVTVKPVSETKQARAMWGTTRAHINNMVKGVSTGFTRKLEINGVGYRADVQGKVVKLKLGYSHDIDYDLPEGITVVAEKPTLLAISGADRQKVGQVAAEIRRFRGPEPYKGKGIKFEEETILRKEGKKK